MFMLHCQSCSLALSVLCYAVVLFTAVVIFAVFIAAHGEACHRLALWCSRQSGLGCASAGCLQRWCVAKTVSTQMVQHASTHGRFTARGARHLPPFLLLSLPLCQRLSLSVFLSVFCTCCSRLYRSVLLSVSPCLCLCVWAVWMLFTSPAEEASGKTLQQ